MPDPGRVRPDPALRERLLHHHGEPPREREVPLVRVPALALDLERLARDAVPEVEDVADLGAGKGMPIRFT